MPRGLSFHFGLGTLDRYRYEQWPDLPSARQDAIDLCAIARKNGFEATLYLDEQATGDNLRKAIDKASKELVAGDILLITFAGHGYRSHTFRHTRPRPDEPPGCDNRPAESEGWDCTLCFYNERIIDDEFYSFWCHLKEGVRVVFVTDSCESGTIQGLRSLNDGGRSIGKEETGMLIDKQEFRTDATVDIETVFEIDVKPNIEEHHIQPVVLIMSASVDTSRAKNGLRNGVFTGGFLNAWRERSEDDTYLTFFQKVCEKAQESYWFIQPSCRFIGRSIEAMNAFAAQKPLSF